MRLQRETPHVRCAVLASQQYGVLAREQVIANGMTPRMIARAVNTGEWNLLYPRIYLVAGAPVSWKARTMGAVLGAGTMSAASHRASAYLLGLDGFGPSVVEITSPRCIRWNDVEAHRAPALLRHEIRKIKGIPTATANHTLLALGAVVGDDRLEAALDSALVKGLTSPQYLAKRVKGSGRTRSTSTLKRLLRERLDGRLPSESELERLYERMITRPYSLLEPVGQFRIESPKVRRIDFAYPAIRLGVELLGWRVHGAFVQWQYDLDRHNQLTNLGWEMLYFPWTAVKKRPEHVAAQVRAAIERRLLNR